MGSSAWEIKRLHASCVQLAKVVETFPQIHAPHAREEPIRQLMGLYAYHVQRERLTVFPALKHAFHAQLAYLVLKVRSFVSLVLREHIVVLEEEVVRLAPWALIAAKKEVQFAHLASKALMPQLPDCPHA